MPCAVPVHVCQLVLTIDIFISVVLRAQAEAKTTVAEQLNDTQGLQEVRCCFGWCCVWKLSCRTCSRQLGGLPVALQQGSPPCGAVHAGMPRVLL
jgi:hypothetical protein